LGLFDRLFGRDDVRAARRAELTGDLARAVVLWVDAGRPDEAARVMILRGDSEPDPRARLQHYTQAAATAPALHDTNRQARHKRALLTMTLAGDAAISTVARADVLEAAKDLEAIGDPAKAAEAYALAGDPEGEAHALAKAGDVDKLEDLLSSRQTKERGDRRRQDAHGEIDLLLTGGRRRDALRAAEAFSREQPEDALAQERARSIAGRRVTGPVARIQLKGRPLTLVLGDEVVIGRTEGSLTVPSNAISRKHLSIARHAAAASGPSGEFVVRDLGSRNGTQLRGMALAGQVNVGEGLELSLGREVPLKLTPSDVLPGALGLELHGDRYVAPLGVAKLAIGEWRLEVASDGWLELVTDDAPPALMDGMTLAARITLLVGDAITSERGGDPVLRVVA
jgi:hypothetical protein